MRLLVLGLLLVGCGPAPGYWYVADCIEFESHVRLNAFQVNARVAKAKALFEDRFGTGTFCENRPFGPVMVFDLSEWDCLGVGRCAGYTNLGLQVSLERTGYGFLHEMFHVWELRHMEYGTASHKNWKEQGYDDLDQEFKVFSGNRLNSWITP